MGLYLYVREPTGQLHLWPLGDPDEATLADAVDRVKVFHGVPVDWIEVAWDVAIAPGEPHPERLAEAMLHRLTELAAVTDQQTQAYRDAQQVSLRQAQIATARDALAVLSPEARAEALQP